LGDLLHRAVDGVEEGLCFVGAGHRVFQGREGLGILLRAPTADLSMPRLSCKKTIPGSRRCNSALLIWPLMVQFDRFKADPGLGSHTASSHGWVRDRYGSPLFHHTTEASDGQWNVSSPLAPEMLGTGSILAFVRINDLVRQR
jgi:hypothetical protein